MQTSARRVLGWLLLLGLAQSGLCASIAEAAMTCSIEHTVGVSFGSYDSGRTIPLDSTGTVAFRCSNVGMADMITIDLGRGDSNTFFPRAMSFGTDKLEYNLFLDASRTVVWGDGTMGTSNYVVHPSEGQAVSIPIFGRVPPRQSVHAGSYADVIIVTVLY